MSTREVLAALTRAREISGQALAEQLGVTRAAVWKQITRLRGLGVAIDAAAGAGYRLREPVQLLDAGAIRAAMTPSRARRLATLDVAFEIDSTSSELLRRAARGEPGGQVCFAERQSAGRGRRGRAWQSPLGANLYFSLLWRFDTGLSALAGLSLIVGIALSRRLRELGATDVAVKWPNDLVVAGRKLAGILVEVGGEWNGPCHAVIGVGLNLRMPSAVGEQIDQPWCDLATVMAEDLPERSLIAGRLLDALVGELTRFEREGAAATLAEFAQHDALAGRLVDVIEPTTHWRGHAIGIDELGRLRVRDDEGREHALASAEVSVRAGDRS